MAGLFEELSRVLASARPGYEAKLAPGATDEAVAAFREAIGVALPEVFYDLFRWHDGDNPASEFPRNLVERCDFDSLASVLSSKRTMDSLERNGTFNKWVPGEWWNLAWVPLFNEHAYDMILVDTAGCFGGAPGQILKWSKDSASRDILFPSIEKLLEVLIATNDAGLWVADGDGWHIIYAREAEAHAIVQKICPDFPKKASARSRESVGEETPLPNATFADAMPIHARYWAPDMRAINDIAIAADAKTLLVAQGPSESGGVLSILDFDTGEVRERLVYSGFIRKAAFAGDGILYVRQPMQLELVYRDANGERVLAELGTRLNLTFGVSRDGKRAILANDAIRVLELPSGKATLDRLTFSGRFLFAIGETRRGAVGWDFTTGERVFEETIRQDDTMIYSAVAPSDGAHAFRAGNYGDVTRYGHALTLADPHDDVHGRMRAFVLSADERYLVSAGDDGVIAIRDLARGK